MKFIMKNVKARIECMNSKIVESGMDAYGAKGTPID